MLIPSSRFSKMAATGIRVPRNTQAPLSFPGTLSTTGHSDQSSAAMARPPPDCSQGVWSGARAAIGPCPLTPGPYNQSVRIAYLDAFSGISGDMTVGALLDAGAPAETLIDALKRLGMGASFEVETTKRGGLTASKFRVITEPHGHSHRHLKHILGMIERAPLSARAKQNASDVFRR